MPTSDTCLELEMSRYWSDEQWRPINLSMASEQMFFTTREVRRVAEVSKLRNHNGSMRNKELRASS